VWGFGSKTWEQLKALRQDTDVGGDFTHPQTGFDIRVTRKGTGQFDTEYTLLPGRPKPLTADAELLKTWVASQHDLAEFAVPPSYERIMEMVSPGGATQQAAPPGAGKLKGKAEPEEDEDDPWAASAGKPSADDLPF